MGYISSNFHRGKVSFLAGPTSLTHFSPQRPRLLFFPFSLSLFEVFPLLLRALAGASYENIITLLGRSFEGSSASGFRPSGLLRRALVKKLLTLSPPSQLPPFFQLWPSQDDITKNKKFLKDSNEKKKRQSTFQKLHLSPR